MSVVDVKVVPVGTDETSLSSYVAAVLDPLDRSGLKYELTSMGTCIEGELEDILRVVREMHERPFGLGVKRVLTTLVIDDRRDKDLSIEGKKKSVTGKRQ